MCKIKILILTNVFEYLRTMIKSIRNLLMLSMLAFPFCAKANTVYIVEIICSTNPNITINERVTANGDAQAFTEANKLIQNNTFYGDPRNGCRVTAIYPR